MDSWIGGQPDAHYSIISPLNPQTVGWCNVSFLQFTIHIFMFVDNQRYPDEYLWLYNNSPRRSGTAQTTWRPFIIYTLYFSLLSIFTITIKIALYLNYLLILSFLNSLYFIYCVSTPDENYCVEVILLRPNTNKPIVLIITNLIQISP